MEDLVELAPDEIRAFGAGQYQVARRLGALLDALIADVPEKRRPALVEQDALLDDAVSSAIPRASAPTPSSLTAKGSACHAAGRPTGTNLGRDAVNAM